MFLKLKNVQTCLRCTVIAFSEFKTMVKSIEFKWYCNSCKCLIVFFLCVNYCILFIVYVRMLILFWIWVWSILKNVFTCQWDYKNKDKYEINSLFLCFLNLVSKNWFNLNRTNVVKEKCVIIIIIMGLG